MLGGLKNSILWALARDYGGQIIGFTISICLARLLTPEDFGLVGISLEFIQMLKILTSFGLNEALIQDQQASSTTFNSVFVVNCVLGGSIAVLLFVFAPHAAHFYGREKLILLIRALAVIFLMQSINGVQISIFQKKMKFKALAFRDLIAQSVSGGAAVGAAFMGYGVYALVLQHLLANILKTILLWSASEWKPQWQVKKVELMRLKTFASYSFFGQALARMIQEAYVLFIGKIFTPATLGFFSRANSFSKLIVQNSSNSLKSVLFPALSKIQKDDKAFMNAFYRAIMLASVLAVFLSAWAFMNGEFLILNLFGAQWLPTVPMFQWLMVRGVSTPISAIIISSMLAKGMAKENFKFGNLRRTLSLLPLLALLARDIDVFLKVFALAAIMSALVSIYAAQVELKASLLKLVLPWVLAMSVSLAYVNWIAVIFEHNDLSSFLLKSMTFVLFFFSFMGVFYHKSFASGLKQVLVVGIRK